MTDHSDLGVMSQRLREWVHKRFGVWITYATAIRAIRFIMRGTES